MYLVSVFDLDFKRRCPQTCLHRIWNHRQPWCYDGLLNWYSWRWCTGKRTWCTGKRSMMMGQALQWLNVLQLHIVCPNQHLWYDQDANWKAQPPLLDIIWGWAKFAALFFLIAWSWLESPCLDYPYTPTGGSAQSVWHHGQHWQLAVSSVNSAAVLVTDGSVQFKPDNRSG